MGVNASKLWLSVGAGSAATFLIYSLWKVDRPLGPSAPILGLQNSGNTCFLNAILQALASCRFMLGWLRQKDEECNYISDKPVTAIQSYSGMSYPLIAALFRAILIMNRDIEVDDNIYSSKVPGDVLSGLRCHGHRIGIQQEQDCYEVFLTIAMALNHEVELSVRRKQTGSMGVLTDGLCSLESPEEELALSLKANVNVNIVSKFDMNGGSGDWAVVGEPEAFRVNDHIFSKRQIEMKWDYKQSPKNPFRCLLFSQMQCIVCMSKTNVRLEAADSLTLTLPGPEHSARLSIEDLFLKYMRPTLVHNVDCETCTGKNLRELRNHSKMKTTFFKYNYIAKLPNSLCIHIPRCSWGPFGMVKRSDYIAFPERMNLGLLKRLYDTTPQEQETLSNQIQYEGAELSPSGNECGLRRFRNSEYRLVAVISHYGSDVENGHFVTFRRLVSKDNPNISSWYYISDDVVRPVPFSCVLTTRAYMLFYEKTFVKE